MHLSAISIAASSSLHETQHARDKITCPSARASADCANASVVGSILRKRLSKGAAQRPSKHSRCAMRVYASKQLWNGSSDALEGRKIKICSLSLGDSTMHGRGSTLSSSKTVQLLNQFCVSSRAGFKLWNVLRHDTHAPCDSSIVQYCCIIHFSKENKKVFIQQLSPHQVEACSITKKEHHRIYNHLPSFVFKMASATVDNVRVTISVEETSYIWHFKPPWWFK